MSNRNNYVRPELKDAPGITITGGRHPVIEQLHDTAFVANNTQLTPEKSLQLITGPNMAGKSTYIRQVALVVLLAHTGCFVPAESASIGITDRIFTRIGAHDNLRAGQSTFMVEMLETAHIMHNATERSLVILDEVGRGTSPEDGFALAWAIADSLAQGTPHPGPLPKGARETETAPSPLEERVGVRRPPLVLFATHFHALKEIAHHHSRVFNSHLAVAIDNDDLIFLRKMTSGPTDESYGIVVAEKAGLPKSVIRKAKQLAAATEKFGPSNVSANQLSLLASAPVVQNEPSQVEEKLKLIDINNLTPLQALHQLEELTRLIK